MSEDEPDLEPIDLSAPTEPTPATGVWAPGWYADPWTAGQYRYWSGQAWTGETNRWGPSNTAMSTPGEPGAATDPWPAAASPVSSGYGWTSPRPAEAAPDAAPPRRRRGPMIAGTTAVVIAVLISGAIGFAIDSHSHSKSIAQAPSTQLPFNPTPSTAAPSTVPGAGVSHDPDRQDLATIVVRQSDVNASRSVFLIPSGNLLTQPTLDLCNGTYASERQRTARLQVADVDAASGTNTSLSTEAVLYRDPASSRQAFAELRKVSATCPHQPVVSPVGEGTAETVFNAPPDGTWAAVPTIERQAYSFVSASAATATQPATSTPSVAVYLRRGRALLGLYFSKPTGAQLPVAGQRTIEGIVAVFEARLAKLPLSVVKTNS